jgi:outer membrane protein assembly factor BamE (lipoprotein component of BamABCDE complex)
MQARPSLLAVLPALLVILSGGCQTETVDAELLAAAQHRQKYEFSEIRKRVKALQPGMPRVQVMLQLGSPADMRGNTWIYLPERPGLLLPAEMLEVRFQGGRYLDHAYRPIVFGETMN